MSNTTIHVIINPACGARIGEDIFQHSVSPLLKAKDWILQVFRTECEGDGSRIGSQIRSQIADGQEFNLVLLGGDGTTHEVLNGLLGNPGENDGKYALPPKTRIALVPCGTANALYSSLHPPSRSSRSTDVSASASNDTEPAWRLESLKSLMASSNTSVPQLHPLALASVSTFLSNSRKTSIAHLITSHALHASILADSEALREEHPGIERFKMAAQKNMTIWIDGKIHLKPRLKDPSSHADSHLIERYSPLHHRFEIVESQELALKGPFIYMACVSTDRLEPSFVPAPFSGPGNDGELTRPSDALDLVLIRPGRDPLVHSLAQKERLSPSSLVGEENEKYSSIREEYAKTRLPVITQAMYSEGKHVNLTFDQTANSLGLEEHGQGEPICEYFRCAGYRWLPCTPPSQALRTCIDGTVVESEKTEVRVIGADEGAGRILAWV